VNYVIKCFLFALLLLSIQPDLLAQESESKSETDSVINEHRVRFLALPVITYAPETRLRLGASALMQGLADGYFVIPYTIGNYFGNVKPEKVSTDRSEFKEVETEVKDGINKLLNVNGKQTVDDIHRKLGELLIADVGMSREKEKLEKVIEKIRDLRDEFWKDVKVVGKNEEFNQTLERAGRVADYLELGELMAIDSLDRNESCGAHFREEYQTPDGEAVRNDEEYAYVAAWEYEGPGKWKLHKEDLEFEYVKLATRSYK